MALENKTRQIRELLAGVNLFKNCDIPVRDEISYSLEALTFHTDQVIFSKGDRLQALFIIERGRVKVHDGDYLFAEFGPQDFFGEYSLIDASYRSATVTALEETRVLRLNKDQFDRLIDRNSKVARAIMETLIQRLRNCNVLEERLSQKSQEIHQEKELIEYKRNELEKLNATKDKFFSLIAHDLKNPFNTIIGLSELLLQRFESYSGPRMKEIVRQIYNYSTHTYTLLDNMLQWARSQTRQIKVNFEQIDLNQLIQDNINLLQNKADDKTIHLKTHIQPGADKAWADENMISTVVRNLISNAIKFTPQNGQVTIQTRLYDNHHLQLTVMDTGIGIAKEDLPKLFDLNTGHSTKGTNAEKGTGLGLILCKEFVNKNNGIIWAESEPEQGSSFHFILPLTQGDHPENATQ